MKGKTVSRIIEKVNNTPWSLVLVKKQYIHHEHWIQFRSKLVITIAACLAISVLIVYILATLLTSLIRKAEEMQLNMLKDAEHTDKLASIGRLAAGVGHEINNPLAIIHQKTGLIEDLLLDVRRFRTQGNDSELPDGDQSECREMQSHHPSPSRLCPAH